MEMRAMPAGRTAATLLVVICLGGCGGSPQPGPASTAAGETRSAEQVLERMFAVYRECRTYADNAVYRERWVLREDGVVREPPPQMVSVSFERPAKIRVTRRLPDAEGGIAEEYTLVSTGSRMYHTLPRFPRQVLEAVAPLTLTADNVAAAPHVSEGLFFVPLEDSFPQIDLLLSSEPQDRALAGDSTPTLLDDALLGDWACYRVSLSSNAGQRVYWIDKESHLLRRLDLSPGTVRQAIDPHDQLQAFERWIEFTDAVVNRELPAAAFELDVPDEAAVVRTWVNGFPGPEPSGDVSPEERELYAAQLARYEADLAAAAAETETAAETRNILSRNATVVEIAQQSMPQTLRLERGWQAEGLRDPGNIYVVDAAHDSRIYVIDGVTAVAELRGEGTLVERHEPPALGDDRIDQLQTAVDANGRRWFAVGGLGWQRVHLFDAQWNHQWSFPEHDHDGFGSFLFAPLGDAGSPQLVVGFWGDLGVHAVSLEGRRQWVDRLLQQVRALALAPDDSQNPVVWTAHGHEVIGRVGKDGPLPPLLVPGRAVVDLAAADLNGDGRSEACGIAAVEPGVYDAVGLDATGREIWSYRLPQGEFLNSAMRRIVAARSDALTGWILPAPDGSIHLVAADGELIDKFNYGKTITGIEFTEHEGRPLLIVSSPEGTTAWRLE